MAGTDTAAGVHIFPGFSLHDELGLFVKAGMTPLEALQTATWNPAKFLGTLSNMGTVEKDKVADLVLLDSNPLDDIALIQKGFAPWWWRAAISPATNSTECFSRLKVRRLLRTRASKEVEN